MTRIIFSIAELMSSSLATILALLLYAAAAIPAVLMLVRPNLAGPLAMSLGFVIAGLGIWQTGIFQPGLTSTKGAMASLPREDQSRCRQIVDLLIEGSVVQKSAQDDALTVREDRWKQLPPEVQEVARNCLKGETPAPVAGGQD